MFNNENNNPEVSLGGSYNKNYEFLFKDTKVQDNLATFNDLPIFKYKKLILKYDKLPSENQIRLDIQDFMKKINRDDNFKVFNIKANTVKTDVNSIEYVITVAFINVDIK